MKKLFYSTFFLCFLSGLAIGQIVPTSSLTLQSKIELQGTSVGISEISNAIGLGQNQFSVEDINLTQCFIESGVSDLRLPGINGLDLIVSRFYKSGAYRSSTTPSDLSQKEYGFGMGRGWGLSVIMRAFVVYGKHPFREDTFEKVVIQMNGGLQEYSEKGTDGYLRSKNPNDKSLVKVDYEKQIISLVQPDGTVFTFSDVFYKENYTYYTGIKAPINFFGVSLTSISNYLTSDTLEGANKITFQYEEVSPGQMIKNFAVDGFEANSLKKVVGIDFYEYLGCARQVGIVDAMKRFGGDTLVRKTLQYDGKSWVISSEGQGFNQTRSITIVSGSERMNIMVDVANGKAYLGSINSPILNPNTKVLVNDTQLLFSMRYYDEAKSTTTLKRLKTIQDTMGRVVTFVYEQSRNENEDVSAKPYQVTEIQYVNTNGGTNSVSYTYDRKGCLSKAQQGSLPATRYTYQNFYPVLERPVITKEKFSGYLLSSIGTPLGTTISYTYQDMTCYDNLNRYGSRGVFIVEGSSIPVVKYKTIQWDGNWFQTKIQPYFEVDLSGKYTRAYYNPNYLKDDKIRLFYFAKTTLTYTSNFSPVPIQEEYTFNKGVLTGKKQGDYESKTEWDYDKWVKLSDTNLIGWQSSKTEYSNFDIYNNPKTITLKRSYVNLSVVDKQLSVKSITYWHETVGADEPKKPRYLWEKSAVQKMVITDLVDNRTVTLRSEYYPTGKLKGSYKNDIQQQTFTYDGNGRVLESAQKNANGSLTKTTYGYSQSLSKYTTTQTLNGKTITTEQELYTGKPVKLTDENGNITQMAYDDFGRPVTVTYPDASTRGYSYSPDLKTETETVAGRSVKTTIDSLGRVIKLDLPEGEEDSTYTYAWGTILTESKKGAVAISYTYDDYLRKKTVTHSVWGVTSYVYNNTINSVEVTYPKGKKVVTSFDPFGKEVQVDSSTNGVNGFIKVQSISSDYNGSGMPIRVWENAEIIKSRGVLYTADGQVDTTYFPTEGGLTSTMGISPKEKYSYYDNGQIKSMETWQSGAQQKSNAFGSVYDNEGRVKLLTFNNADVETYTYDEMDKENGKGKLTTIQNTAAQSRFDYNTMGNLKRETKTLKDDINQTYILEYDYTTFGSIQEMRYKDSSNTLQYQINYVYNAAKRVSEVTYKGHRIIQYDYYPNGTIKTMTYGNGLILTNGYKNEVLVSNIEVKDGTSSLYSLGIYYDEIGNVTQATGPAMFSKTTMTRDYGYTDKDELKSIQQNTKDLYTYTYNRNGNIIVQTDANETPYGHDSQYNNLTDRLTKRVFRKSGSWSYQYDERGNATKRTVTDWSDNVKKTNDYTYNYQNQLTEFKTNGASQYRYTYDTSKQRISKTNVKTGEKRIYHWDQLGRIIAEGSPSNPFEIRYIYKGNEKIAMIRKGTDGSEKIYYFINDLVGTTRFILDQNKKVVQKLQLSEWGQIEKVKGPFRDEINFTGKKIDKETGFYYFNQRYYDPSVMRFIQEDPAGQGTNPYAYCGNNPCIYVDADGQFAWLPFAIAMLQGAALSAGISAAEQMIITGRIDWGNVMQSAAGGAIGGGIFYGMGSFADHMGWASGDWQKIALHTTAGGVSSMAQGGNFMTGAIGGGVSQAFAPGIDMLGSGIERIGASSLVGGISSWAAGGDAIQGAVGGGFGRAFNEERHGLNQRNALDTSFDVGGIILGTVEVAAYDTAAAPYIGAANLVMNGGGLYRTYQKYGFVSRQMGTNIVLTAFPHAKYISRIYRPIVSFGTNSASLIYGHLDE